MNAIWHGSGKTIPCSRRTFSFSCAPSEKSFWRRGLTLLLAFKCFTSIAGAEAPREYKLKAVFLYNFSKFTDWPEDAFASPDAPLVIGVLGKDPFGPYLREAVDNEKVAGRTLVVQNFKSVEDVKFAHILFISDSETRRMPEIFARLRGRSILTVGDSDTFMQQGGMVRFYTQNNRIHLRINPDALKAARLKMSSKLLRTAEIVTTEDKHK